MNKNFIELFNYLFEARRGLKKVPLIKKLESLKDDSNIYFHFSSVNKIGINPGFDYTTPLGLYTYNLKNSWDHYSLKYWKSDLSDMRNLNDFMPYMPSESKYLFILKRKSSRYKFVNIFEYSKNHLKRDIEKLKNIILNNNSDSLNDPTNQQELKDILETFDNLIKADKSNHPFKQFYVITKHLASHPKMEKLKFTSVFKIAPFSQKDSREWTWILKEIMGYGGFDDPGLGIIHPFEDSQAIFLDKSNYDIVDLINIDSKNDRSYGLYQDQSPDQSFLRLRKEI